jgi:enoyl-CoA hydratase
MALFTWEHQDGVARIFLNHPRNNTLTIELMEGLISVVNNMSAAPAGVRPKVIVLGSSVAGQFSQGIDPHAIVNGDLDTRKKIFRTLGDLVESLWFSYIPVIADVNGPAIAGGAVLAMLADFIVMDAERAKICFSEVKVGLPVPGFIQRLVQVKTSPAYWTEMLLLGRNVDAAEALKIGIANGTYANPSERDKLVNQYISKITRLAPAVLSETLRQSRSCEHVWLEAFRADMASFAVFLSDEYVGGALKSVLAGESPKFK